ncbi:hypothetical protein [Flavobacterium seoulense]|uniref:Phosphatidate cytidylyltransferase n=1 Tax=Flavobacterium seoulense TaxID=1492738 RepID=A0A066WIF8_9FLAO|nr:hypothetical protein [Flavobacterium seoulense]KDN53792.1 hypothetical protein FEM21_31090 [Flavobacterium seoulense]
MQNTLKRTLLLLTVMFTFTSCEVIGGIFKAGMGVGIFLVIAVIALIIFLISKIGGK